MKKGIQTALILAGGDGDRFAPLEQKVRYRFNGKTVLQHIVEAVAEYAKQVVVVTNEVNMGLIKSDLGTDAIEYVVQTKDDGGMADAVLAAEKYINGDVIIFNGNDLLDFSLIPSLVEQTKKEGTLLGLVAKHETRYLPTGYVRFVDNKAVEIVEKPARENAPSEYVRLVVDYFPTGASFLTELKKLSATDDQYEKAMSALMKQKPATCLKYTGDWSTLKYSWHVLAMQDYVFEHTTGKRSEDLSIHPSSIIEGNISIGKNVYIGAFVKIMGPCFIGDNVIIGDHSLVRGSTICDNVIVGSGCEVARSYLGMGVMLHRNYVGDSVLGPEVTMGAGAVTANFRFDKKTVRTPIKGTLVDSGNIKFGLIAGARTRIGVNTTTYPGVKLAPDTVVLPGEVITKDK